MNKNEIAKALDIHNFLDRLEQIGNAQDYYKINHLSSRQREELALKIADSLINELKTLGLNVKQS